MDKKDFQKAYEFLNQSYQIFLKIGRLDGIAFVSVSLGQLIYSNDQEQGLEILNRSLKGFHRLGMVDWVKHVQNLIDELKKPGGGGIS